MKINVKVLLAILAIVIGVIAYLTVVVNSLNRDVEDLNNQIKQQRISTIITRDSLSTIQNNKVQARMDSLITSLQTKRTTIKSKGKKQNETLDNINASGIVLPNF